MNKISFSDNFQIHFIMLPFPISCFKFIINIVSHYFEMFMKLFTNFETIYIFFFVLFDQVFVFQN